MTSKPIFSFEQIGDLTVERVLFESYYPILFTCRSSDQTLYLCVCCLADTGRKKWLLTNVKPDTVAAMLKNRITIRDAFLQDKGHRYTIRRDKDGSVIERDNQEDWHPENSDCLPALGECIDPEENEFDEEIRLYNTFQYSYAVGGGVYGKNAYPMFWDISIYGKIIVSSEKCVISYQKPASKSVKEDELPVNNLDLGYLLAAA